MNGVHDMGGMHGFGAVDPTDDAPFHDAWEERLRAMMGLTMQQGVFNLDAFRYGIEQMDPAAYLASSYFERWLASVEHNLIQAGVLTREELDARTAHFREHPDASTPGEADDAPRWQPPEPREEPELPHIRPRFAVGDPVLTRNVHPAGHTRLPRYARGKRGTINMIHGPEVFADTNAHNQGEHPQVVYSVRFDARELWGESAEPRQTVSIDLWESYLEPA
jgi:nitrile hydratase